MALQFVVHFVELQSSRSALHLVYYSWAARDVVVVVGPGGSIAKGLVIYGAGELKKIQGKKSAEIEGALGSRPFDEAIHLDNMVLL